MRRREEKHGSDHLFARRSALAPFRAGEHDHGEHVRVRRGDPTYSVRVYATQAPVRELYERIKAYDGGDCFAEVLSPWLGENSAEVAWLAEVAGKEQDAWRPTGEELCRLYAFARVNELLLLAFQSPPPEGWPGPRLSREQYS